jgi:deoxyadenosine/deoxycytidine kinase
MNNFGRNGTSPSSVFTAQPWNGRAQLGTRRLQLVVNVEGNIGLGKSLCGRELVKQLNAANHHAIFLPEPVDDWDRAGLLQAFYDGRLSAASFQQMALATRYAKFMSTLWRAYEVGPTVLVVERSVASDSIFAKLNIRDTHEMEAYDLSASLFVNALPTQHDSMTLLLDADVEHSVQRIQKRERASEMTSGDVAPHAAATGVPAEQPAAGNGLSREYLSRLRAEHCAWFSRVTHTKHRVDASGPSHEVIASMLEHVRAQLAADSLATAVRPPSPLQHSMLFHRHALPKGPMLVAPYRA